MGSLTMSVPWNQRENVSFVPDPAIEYQDVSPADACNMLDELVGLYREVFGKPPYNYGDEHVELFRKRTGAQSRREGFALVAARDNGELVGFSFGLTMPPSAPWWTDLVTEIDEEITAEPPGRTFVFIELVVREEWQGSGIATRLHDQLLRGRPEGRATLTVRPEAEAAQAAYTKWGWRKVAQKRNPLPGSPIYDVLIKPLA